MPLVVRPLPAVRRGGTVHVNFTARAGPTPAREDFDAAQAAAVPPIPS